jgi:hypothetical protein
MRRELARSPPDLASASPQARRGLSPDLPRPPQVASLTTAKRQLESRGMPTSGLELPEQQTIDGSAPHAFGPPVVAPHVGTVSTLEHELKTARQKHGGLEQELRDARAQVEAHEAKCRELTQQKLALETAAARKEQDRQATEAKLATATQAVRELHSRIDETVLRPLEAAQRHVAAGGADT